MDYWNQFDRYESARKRYQMLQDDMTTFLEGFTGNPEASEQELTFRDLAYMEGLRIERDIAFADFYKAEAEIFKALIGRLFPEKLH